MPKKKIYFGTNLKMYKGRRETKEYLLKLEEKMDDLLLQIKEETELFLFVIPSYTSLGETAEIKNRIRIGAQNMAWEEKGQYTGEISPLMLKELGVDLVMVGHSERRQIFMEEDWMENRKVKAALNHNFMTLLCVGESERDKEFGIAEEVLRRQLKIGLHGVKSEQTGNLLIAYEPVWAIGTRGRPASSEYVSDKHKMIKKCLKERFSDLFIPVLYGGSVNRENASALLSISEVDGLFVGRSAWNAEDFISLMKESLVHINAVKLPSNSTT